MVGKQSSRVVDGEGRRGRKRVVGRKREAIGKKSSRAEGGEGQGNTERVAGG